MEPETGHHGAEPHVYAHEKSDAGVRSAAILGGAFVILLVFGCVTGFVAFRFFNSPETVGPPASPISAARLIPTGPRLQVNGHEDLLDYLHQQDHVLSTYGWVDEKAGVVRIPIEEAMDTLLRNGLPVRGAEPKDKATTARQKPATGQAKASPSGSGTGVQ